MSKATTPTSPSAHEIERFLAWRLVRTGREVERALTDTIAEHGLTTTQFGVLSLLATGADLTQSDLARAVLVRPQSVGPLITSLTERGLIARRGPDGRGR
ncbi:MAG: MarR family transcriptional regulator, partial [Pseudonocardia sp.]|nr:MarR family transcriptional regulator [Pseudonocardia sp.]